MHAFKNLDYLSPLRKQPVLSVHIVCLGNICRSPIANAVLLDAAKDLTTPKVKVDSSGTGAWHVGQDAAEYSKQVWQEAGYEYEHIAKQFKSDFFQKHDLILAMDLSNRSNLLKFAQSESDKNKIIMFTSFDPGKSQIDPDGKDGNLLSVPDPYGGSIEQFHSVLKIIEQAATGFVTWVRS
ncbi:MAG: low molecular weight protein-tyrosine-phosphatase [Candidatus Nanopelagicus sp.]